jgi:hypothetical protein
MRWARPTTTRESDAVTNVDKMPRFTQVARQDASAAFWAELATRHDLASALNEALDLIVDAYENAEPDGAAFPDLMVDVDNESSRDGGS